MDKHNSTPVPQQVDNLIGRVYARGVVIGYSHTKTRKDGSSHRYWFCQCPCGAIDIVRSDVLKSPVRCSHRTPGYKKCSGCHQKKPFEAFHKNKATFDGYHSHCKECRLQLTRDFYQEHKEQISASAKAYRQANPEATKEKERRKYYRNADKINDRCKKWIENNLEKFKERQRKWNAKHYAIKENRERRNSVGREWKRNNRDRVVVARNNRRTRELGAPGSVSHIEIQAMLESQNGRCAYHGLNPQCCGDIRGRYTIDHIVPLFRGGSNYPENLQLTCSHCNSSKGKRTHEEYLDYLHEVY